MLSSIPLPFVDSFQFNRQILPVGIPVCYKYQENDHYFYALVQECSPFILTITNGTIERHMDIREVISDQLQIIPLSLFEEHPEQNAQKSKELILEPCRLFDEGKIPIGSIFIDADGTSFMVHYVDQFCLTLVASTGSQVPLYADVFFGIDEEESKKSRLYLPPLYEEEG